MATATKINDSSTWRNIRSVFVNDSSTWRPIKKIFVNDGGTWRTVFSSFSLSTTLTIAEYNYFYIDGDNFDRGRGYDASVPYGSLGGTDIGGGTAVAVADYYYVDASVVVNNYAWLRVSGLSADPGQTAFTNATVNGVSRAAASATTYVWNPGSGFAEWLWEGSPWGLAASGSVSVEISQ